MTALAFYASLILANVGGARNVPTAALAPEQQKPAEVRVIEWPSRADFRYLIAARNGSTGYVVTVIDQGP
jgi:hypothetical protein